MRAILALLMIGLSGCASKPKIAQFPTRPEPWHNRDPLSGNALKYAGCIGGLGAALLLDYNGCDTSEEAVVTAAIDTAEESEKCTNYFLAFRESASELMTEEGIDDVRNLVKSRAYGTVKLLCEKEKAGVYSSNVN